MEKTGTRLKEGTVPSQVYDMGTVVNGIALDRHLQQFIMNLDLVKYSRWGIPTTLKLSKRRRKRRWFS